MSLSGGRADIDRTWRMVRQWLNADFPRLSSTNPCWKAFRHCGP